MIGFHARIWPVFVLTIALLSLMACDTQNSQSTQTESQTVSAIGVSSHQLFADYHANEVSADSKYKNKYIAVTGRITKIRKDAFDHMVIDLHTPNPFMNTQAIIREQDLEAVANLKRRQEIMLLCIGQGLFVGSPMLSECRVVDQKRDTITYQDTGQKKK